MEVRWTPSSEYEGSMRFSKRHRDAMGEEYARWAQADTPEWQYWAACTAASLTAYVLLRAAHRLLRRLQSDRAARALLLDESRAAAAAAESACSATATQQRTPTGKVERVCRFCDVPVTEDDMMALHLGGKRHRRMVALAGSAAGDVASPWVWREATPPPPEPAPAPAPEVEIPTQQNRGKGRWEQPKRRGVPR